MRRAVVMLVSLLGLMSGALASAPAAQALSAPEGVEASKGKAFDAVIISWKWSTAPAAYVVQIAADKKFRDATRVDVPARGSKPPGGRQSYKLTGLPDGTKFFVRVAAASTKGKLSGWSGVQTATTRMRLPSAPTGAVKAVPGPGPGQLTFTWSSKGDYTDYYALETATSPFDPRPRDHTVFHIDPKLRTYTLTAAQTQQAHAGIGTAWTLVWRFRAVNTGTAGGREERYFGQGQSRVMGEAATGPGSAIRVASYNIRTDNISGPAAITWDSRAPRIARLIKDRRPGIVLLQELFPSMVPKFLTTLAQQDMGSYALDRQTALVTGAPGEQKLQNRILYDKTRYDMVDQCSVLVASTDCHISWPTDAGPDYSPFVKMRDRASGQEFYVLGFHLPRGEGLDAVRTAAMRSIVDQVEALNTEHLPVIVGGDSNSSQLRTGERPHDVLMEHGFYDTASTVDHVNPEYGTANDFTYQDPSPFGVSPRIDVIATLGMPGSDRFVNEVVEKGEPFPSDHNMIWTDLRLP